MFDQTPFRIQPAGPAHAYRTFQIHRPREPEAWQSATCEEVQCEAFLNGWITRVPATDEWLVRVRDSGRTWVSVDQTGGEWVFTFSAGTQCFRASTHRKLARPDTPDLFVVRGGDWRGNPTGEHRIHQRPEDWAEHLHESTDAVQAQLERG